VTRPTRHKISQVPVRAAPAPVLCHTSRGWYRLGEPVLAGAD